MQSFSKNFKLMLISQIISVAGGNILRFAILLFILQFSQSAATFGTVTAISFIPMMVLSIPGGIIADRLPKKKLIIILDGLSALACLALTVILVTDNYNLYNLTMFITFSMGIIAIFQPILLSATPLIVAEDKLPEANGAIQSVSGVAEILGFAAGGILLANIGIQNIAIGATIFFCISTGIDIFIKIPHTTLKSKSGILKTSYYDVKESFRIVIIDKPIAFKMALLFASLAFLFIPIFNVGFPSIASLHFGVSESMIGWGQGLSMGGMILGSLLAGVLKVVLLPKNLGLIMAMGSLLILGLIPALSWTGTSTVAYWLFVVVVMFVVATMVLGNIAVMSAVQNLIPVTQLGKVIAFFMTISNMASPLGSRIFGHLLEQFFTQIPTLIIGISGVGLLVALVFHFWLRKEVVAI